MKLLLLTPFLLLAISSCNSSNNQLASDMLSDPQTDAQDSGPESTPEAEPELVPGVAVITMDNHVDIVANVLAIFSGKLYGDVLFAAPDYSGLAYNTWPEVDSVTAELITQRADIVCSNGGTVTIIPEAEGFPSDNLQTWNLDFDHCQDGTTLLDGPISRAIYESIHISSTGFERDDQTTVVRYAGSLIGRSASFAYWLTDDMDFALQQSNSSLLIMDSTTRFFPNDISGEFKVQAVWTGDQEISVRTADNLMPESDAGELEIDGGEGNTLVLSAATGEVETVNVTITANGISSTVTQPWSLWADNLVFDSVSGY